MENRYSWQRMAVALFDKATFKLGLDARQLQDAMFWSQGEQPAACDSPVANWTRAPKADPGIP